MRIYRIGNTAFSAGYVNIGSGYCKIIEMFIVQTKDTKPPNVKDMFYKGESHTLEP